MEEYEARDQYQADSFWLFEEAAVREDEPEWFSAENDHEED